MVKEKNKELKKRIGVFKKSEREACKTKKKNKK